MKHTKGKAVLTLAKGIRLGITATLSLMLIITSVYFLTRFLSRPKYPSESRDIPPQKIERAEQLVYIEMKGERGSYLLKANRHYIGKDNNYHLEGNVEIIEFGEEGSENISINGEKVTHDKDLNHFVLTGKSTVRYKDWIIESNFLDYDKRNEIFKSSKGMSFVSRQLKGTARKMVYSLREETLELRERVRLKMPQELDSALLMEVEGNELDYYIQNKEGEVAGDVRLTQGKNQYRAHALKFLLAEDKEHIKSILLKGEVKANIEEGWEKENSLKPQNENFASAGKREIEAEEIHLQSFEELSKLEWVKALGNCRYKSIDESGSYIQICGESLDFLFNREGELEKFTVFKNVKVDEHDKNSGKNRHLEGEELLMQGNINEIKIKGKDNVGARVITQDSEIVAKEITLHLDNDNLDASGKIRIVTKGIEGKKSIGYFSKEMPVFIAAEEMRYESDKKRFLFKKDIRVWQQKEMLLTDEFTLYEERGEIICSGGVKTVFVHPLKQGKEEEKIEITADLMYFKPEKNIISFEENTFLKMRNTNVRAHSLSVNLKDEKDGIRMILAQGKVNIIQEKREARAEKATIDLEKEIFILTGEPVVVEKDRGETTGDKLTFYMGDGRIVVENKEGERSKTVIKS